MNRRIGILASLLTFVCVLLFALFMLINMSTAAYTVCIVLAWGYIMMASVFVVYAKKGSEASKYIGQSFAIIYGVFVMLVYYAQITTLVQTELTNQALELIDYKKFGLFFSYDLFGYAMLSISTFFIGLTISVNDKEDKLLKKLLLIHGMFSIVCIIPMLGVFTLNMVGGEMIGIIVLEVWCLYFLPICYLSYRYFKKQETPSEN